MTDDERTVEQLRKEILEWAEKLKQQERDRKLRLGQAKPRNRREDEIFLSSDLPGDPKNPRGFLQGGPA